VVLVGDTDLVPDGGTVPTPLSISPCSAFCETKLSIAAPPRTMGVESTDNAQNGAFDGAGGGVGPDTVTVAVAMAEPALFSAVNAYVVVDFGITATELPFTIPTP